MTLSWGRVRRQPVTCRIFRGMQVEVVAYSGFRADERPLKLILAGREYRVVELLDKWYGPEETWFKVRTDDGGSYILKLSPLLGWTLESYGAKPSRPEQGPARTG